MRARLDLPEVIWHWGNRSADARAHGQDTAQIRHESPRAEIVGGQRKSLTPKLHGTRRYAQRRCSSVKELDIHAHAGRGQLTVDAHIGDTSDVDLDLGFSGGPGL